MRKFKVTIAKVWSTVVEAEDRDKAALAGIKVFQQEVGYSPSGTLFLATRVRTLPEPPEDYSNIPEAEKQNFVGFWEGDGSLSRNYGRPYLGLAQKDPQLLEYFKTLFHLTENTHPATGTYQTKNGPKTGTWNVLHVGRKVRTEPLIEILKTFVVSPYRVEQLQHVLETNDIVEHDPTWPWLAGLYTAEGSCKDSNGTPELDLSQKDSRVLYKLEHCYDGRVTNYSRVSPEIRWIGQKAIYVARNIINHMRHETKRENLYALLKFFKEAD